MSVELFKKLGLRVLLGKGGFNDGTDTRNFQMISKRSRRKLL